MEGGGLLHLENKGNAKPEKNPKASLIEGAMKSRRGLADITNSISQLQRPTKPAVMDPKLPNPPPLSADKECIAQLLKENTALLRLLGEKNKIIELNDQELQRLRLSVQQLQQHNWQLARTNSQMLEELNSGKDRLKALQHELGCTVAVLNVTKLELKGKKKDASNSDNNGFTIFKEQACTKIETAAALEPPRLDEKKGCNPSRKRASRSQSLVSASVAHEERTTIKKEGSRRKSSRRNSGNLKSPKCCEAKEDLFEIEDTKFPLTPSSAMDLHQHESQIIPPPVEAPPFSSSSGACSPTLGVTEEEQRQEVDGTDSSSGGSRDLRRSSIARPPRRATMGVSYKEPPLNTKMRRA